MKNCLEFAINRLTSLLVTLGVFQVLDVLKKFDVVTSVITLDKHYLKTEDVTKNHYGYDVKSLWTTLSLLYNE